MPPPVLPPAPSGLDVNPVVVPLHTVASPIEQEHISQALDATQIAMGAVQTLLSLSQWVLGILGLVLAGIAIFGWVVIRNATMAQAEQIANKRLDAYMESDDFDKLVAKKVEDCVDARWQNVLVAQSLKDDAKPAGDQPAFPEG